MSRFLAVFVAVFAVVAVLPAGAQAPGSPVRPIDEVVAPLAHAPAIVEVGDALVVEVDPLVFNGDPSAASLVLAPSFPVDGTDAAADAVRPTRVESGTSDLWPGRDVIKLTFPTTVGEGLFDIELTWDSADPTGVTDGRDTERRAVQVVDAFPAAPRVAVLADPSIGDPRPIQEGITEMLPPGMPYPPDTDGDPFALPPKVLGTTGNPVEGEERWAALVNAIEEINLVKPDLVLIAGDVTFAAHPSAYPYEYAEAYRVLDRLEVPSFAAPGNHDLYALDYDRYGTTDDPAGRPPTADGTEEWQRWFGPLYYSVDLGENFHLVSLNTFDHPDKRPFPPEDDFDTLSNGHMADEQLEWLTADLTAYRGANPDGALVTLAHHDPSWLSGNHPWGDYTNRNVVRELMADFDVWAHFSGHTHEDRVARYHRGSIAETNGRQHRAHHYEIGKLHYLDINAADVDCVFSDHAACTDNPLATLLTQDELADIIDDPSNGPLFVSTTTTASGLIGDVWGLGGYWGWRLAELAPQEHGGYAAADMGYAADADPADVRAFLDELAERPERWNEDHARLGVHSVPTGFLTETENPDGSVTVSNGLLDDMPVVIAGERRTVPAGGTLTVTP